MEIPNLSSLASLPSLGDVFAQAKQSMDTPTAEGTLLKQGLSVGPVAQLPRAIIIILGLLLIAAGIFGFDKTREVITKAAGTAAAA